MNLEKITGERSTQKLDCMVCEHHQAMYRAKEVFMPGIDKIIDFPICSVCATMTEKEIVKHFINKLKSKEETP